MQKFLAAAVFVGVSTFLWEMADILNRVETWEILWNPPGVGQILRAVAAALVATGAAVKLDVSKLMARKPTP